MSDMETITLDMSFNKMDPEVKARWLTALRSGEYAQTRNTYKDDEGLCCLAVLCTVEGVAPTPEERMPWSSKWVELLDQEPAGVLIGMNDSQGASFLQIADWIEEHL